MHTVDADAWLEREGEGGGLPALVKKSDKIALIWRKNALIVVIYGLNFLFK